MEKLSKSITLVCFGFGLVAKYFVKELLRNKYKIKFLNNSQIEKLKVLNHLIKLKNLQEKLQGIHLLN